jgi:hypothetical protein
MITDNDEFRHPAKDDTNWSESYYFTFSDLKNEIEGFFRIGLEENRQQSNIWASLMYRGQVIYQRFRLNLPYSAAGLENLTVADLHISMIEALKTFRIQLHDRQLSVELNWQGFHDPIDMREVMGEMSGSVAKGHYEQSGIVTGSVRIRDKTIPVDGFGFRDHSWGVRDWEGIRLWKTCVGQFSQDFAIASGEIHEFNGSKSYLGLVYDRGELLAIKDVNIELDNVAKPKTGLATLTAKNDNRIDIDLEFVQVCHMPYDFNELLECYVKLRMGDDVCGGIVEINRSLLP